MRKATSNLATTHPELAKEWHPTKNGNLTPDMVGTSSGKKVWWFYPYDDPKTGKHFDFEWEAPVARRTSQNLGCPYLTGYAIQRGFNDLATVCPELAAQWHPTKNGDLTPYDVTAGSGKLVWWLKKYDDPKTGKHFDFEWQARIQQRARGAECPYLSIPVKAIMEGFNDLGTTHPELAKQWHPTKNGTLTPQDVTWGSIQKVWWLYSYDDPKTGKHFDFEWQTMIATRAKDGKCPFIEGKSLWKGFNDLATVRPELAAQWHPTKNGNLKPDEVTVRSGRKVWWLYPYDDPKTGKHYDFEWQAIIANRTRDRGCPYLSGWAIYPGFNDLATLHPELANEWHPTKNGTLTPQDVTFGTDKKVWWILPYDDPKTGKHYDFEWQASISSRVHGSGCPQVYDLKRRGRKGKTSEERN